MENVYVRAPAVLKVTVNAQMLNAAQSVVVKIAVKERGRESPPLLYLSRIG
jgi:glutamine amidotransferase PdxT